MTNQENDDARFGEFLADRPPDQPIVTTGCCYRKLEVDLSQFTERERRVLELRFGVVDGCARTREEVGQQLKITPEQVRKIEDRALRKMRHPSRKKQLEDFLKANED